MMSHAKGHGKTLLAPQTNEASASELDPISLDDISTFLRALDAEDTVVSRSLD